MRAMPPESHVSLPRHRRVVGARDGGRETAAGWQSRRGGQRARSGRLQGGQSVETGLTDDGGSIRPAGRTSPDMANLLSARQVISSTSITKIISANRISLALL